MQTSRFRLKRVVSITFLVLASLSIGFLISKHIAIQEAINECDSFHLRAEEEPFSIQAQVDVYGGTVVLIVAMEGKWSLSGGPPPAEGQPDPGPVYFDQCTVIINAFTGDFLQLHARPISISE